MKTKTVTHTPGPWTCECTNAGEIGSKDKVRVESASGHIAIACRTKRTERNTYGNVSVLRNLPEVKANAYLIAAAPEGLTLAKIVADMEHLSGEDRRNQEIVARELAKFIIAKAEGRLEVK